MKSLRRINDVFKYGDLLTACTSTCSYSLVTSIRKRFFSTNCKFSLLLMWDMGQPDSMILCTLETLNREFRYLGDKDEIS